jgi:hypothetical protein
MNLKFCDFAEGFREVKDNHSELRRASALTVRFIKKRIGIIEDLKYFSSA